LQDAGGYDRPKEGRLRFVYAGSLGSTYDVESIVQVAKRLAREGFDGAEFVIAGDGPKRAALEKEAKGLPNVRFLGWVGAKDLAKAYASSHVGLACYRRGATQSVTYKLFDYLAAGMPIVHSLPGEMEALVAREKVGRFFEPEDADGLCAIVKELCAERDSLPEWSKAARRFAEAQGDSAKTYQRMAAFLERL
jgi:glycosyltransferase involved in cell wall biosynthesis